MDSIIKNAAKGQRKAVQYLYENNKQKVYFIAKSLLLNEEQAISASIKIFRNIWNHMHASQVDTEEDFTQLVIRKTADYCKQVTTKKNSKAYRIPHYRNFLIPVPTGICGEVDCYEELVLSKLPELHRYIFVLHTVEGVDKEVIKKMLKFDLETIQLALNAEETNIERIILGYKADDTHSYDQIVESLKEMEANIMVPERLEHAAEQIVDIVAKPYEAKRRKKAIAVSAFSIVLCVCIGCGIFLATRTNDSDDTSKGEFSTTDTDESDTDSTETDTDTTLVTEPVVELDDSLTYLAMIDIADYGTITVELNQEVAPVTVANFISLAESGFYDGLTFHRIMEDFMMQGGDPNGDGTGGADYNIVGEFTDNGYENSLSHTRGAISMARSSEYDSASSQFFIVHEDSTSLDGQYAVFGYVIDGLDIVDAVCEAAEPTDDDGTIESDAQPIINSITIVTATTDSVLE